MKKLQCICGAQPSTGDDSFSDCQHKICHQCAQLLSSLPCLLCQIAKIAKEHSADTRHDGLVKITRMLTLRMTDILADKQEALLRAQRNLVSSLQHMTRGHDILLKEYTNQGKKATARTKQEASGTQVRKKRKLVGGMVDSEVTRSDQISTQRSTINSSGTTGSFKALYENLKKEYEKLIVQTADEVKTQKRQHETAMNQIKCEYERASKSLEVEVKARNEEQMQFDGQRETILTIQSELNQTKALSAFIGLNKVQDPLLYDDRELRAGEETIREMRARLDSKNAQLVQEARKVQEYRAYAKDVRIYYKDRISKLEGSIAVSENTSPASGSRSDNAAHYPAWRMNCTLGVETEQQCSSKMTPVNHPLGCVNCTTGDEMEEQYSNNMIPAAICGPPQPLSDGKNIFRPTGLLS